MHLTRSLACSLVLCFLLVGVAWSQITRSSLPADMLGIPTTSGGVIYPITARSGAGSTCTAATLNAALSAIGTKQATLILVPNKGDLTPCTWTLEANVTVSENIHLVVASQVVVSAGMTLTINGPHQTLIGDNWYSGTVIFAGNLPFGSAETYRYIFQDFVISGGLHDPAAGVTTAAFATVAIIQGRHVAQPAAQVSYTSGDGFYWLGIRHNMDVLPAGWTCVPNTRYCWRIQGNIPRPPPGLVLLSRATVTAGAITEVGDYRVDNPYKGSPAMLTSPLFGGVPDCGPTDNTAALQALINNAGWRQLPALAPAGCYYMQSVWLNYDAAENPRYPSAATQQGNYTLRGEGSMQVHHVGGNETYIPGTVFVSTSTDKPAFKAFSPMGQGAPNSLRGLKLRSFSVKQNTSTAVIDIDGANSRSSIEDVFVLQNGIGNGIKYFNTFLTHFQDIFVYTGNTGNTGVGFWIANTTGQGGIINVLNVTGRGFGVTGVRAGVDDENLKRLQSVNLIGVQGTTSPIGIQVLGAMTGGACIGCYTEGTTQYGMEIRNGTQGFSVVGGFFDGTGHEDATDAVVKIGGDGIDATTSNRAWGVTVQGAKIIEGLQGYGIFRNFDANQDGVALFGNSFDAPFVGNYQGFGISCGAGATTTQNNLLIAANHFNTPHDPVRGVEGSCRSGEIVQDGIAVWISRRLNTGQGLVLASDPDVQLPTNGNIYNLTGTATITKITCGNCTPGATIVLFTQGGAGNTPKIAEDLVNGNIFLQAPSGGTETPQRVVNPWAPPETEKWYITLMWDGTKWREQGRGRIAHL